MRLVANAIADEKGAPLGTLLQWVDRSAEVNAEKELRAIVQAAAAGDFSKRIDEVGKAGFMLEIAQGLNAVLNTSEQGQGEISRALNALAEGDTRTIDADFSGIFGEVKADSNSTIERLRGIITQIRE